MHCKAHSRALVVQLCASVRTSAPWYVRSCDVFGVWLCITVLLCFICTQPSMIKPVKALTAIAKAHGSLVLVDGAHAPGVLDIDVRDIGADYYTGNCHKWLYAPKGSAFLWVAPAAQSTMCPQPV